MRCLGSADDLLRAQRMSTVLILLHRFLLATKLHNAVPALSFEDAYAHSHAAIEATLATPGVVDSELLLAMAYIESRYQPTAVSRVIAGKRQTGVYTSTIAPRQLDRRASLFCGPLQTYARSWRECIGMRDLHVAYPTAVGELQRWLRDRRVRGDMRRALAGYGCGNLGVTTGRCNRYPERVLAVERRISSMPTNRAPRASN